MEEVGAAVVKWFIDTTTNEYNIAILGATYGLIWVLTPAFHWLAWHHMMGKRRVLIYQLFRGGKRVAATIWCTVAVWLPIDGLQPPLCSEVATADCQTEAARWITGIVLGVALSGSIAFVMSKLKSGEDRKLHKAKCASCQKTVRVNDLESPCPKCEDSLHKLVAVSEKA